MLTAQLYRRIVISTDQHVSNGLLQGLNFSERLSYRVICCRSSDPLTLLCASDGNLAPLGFQTARLWPAIRKRNTRRDSRFY